MSFSRLVNRKRSHANMWKKSEPEESPFQPVPVPQTPPAPLPQNPTVQTRERSIIGPTISIKGNLTGEEDLLIEGQVEGKIELHRHCVTVGESGRIKADIYGKIIIIEGSIEGNLYGEEQLVVKQSATVRGNIVSPRVALEDGSNFKGNIDVSQKEKLPTIVTAQDKPLAGNKIPGPTNQA
jgi:cytoskeletal protein CcmA (bactofilin family)